MAQVAQQKKFNIKITYNIFNKRLPFFVLLRRIIVLSLMVVFWD